VQKSFSKITELLAILIVFASCTARTVAPATADSGATMDAVTARSPSPLTQPDTTRQPYSAADVQFISGMIAHHAQALVMTALVPSHTSREDIRLLAGRIKVSQQDEIALMRRWLQRRHEAVPDVDEPHAQHRTAANQMGMPGMPTSDHMLMPGMLTQEQLDQLAKATGAYFDRLFLQFMIQHHEGALTMVAQLFSTRGAGLETETFQLASDINADQQAEIGRMRKMLAAPSAGAPQR
jgi:uncharacterized protein (DUF305 family)